MSPEIIPVVGFLSIAAVFITLIVCVCVSACPDAQAPSDDHCSQDGDPSILIFDDLLIDAEQVESVNCGRATTHVYLSSGNELTVNDPDREIYRAVADWHHRNCHSQDRRTQLSDLME